MVEILPASETAGTPGSIYFENGGAKVVVLGTPGNDLIEAVAGFIPGRWTVSVNGSPREINVDRSIMIEVDGAGGGDRLRLVGTEGSDLAILRPNQALMQGNGYTVVAANVESSSFEGRGRRDVARLHGARLARALMSCDDPETELTRTELAGDGFSLAATDEQVHVARDRGFRRLSSARVVPASIGGDDRTTMVASGDLSVEGNAAMEVGSSDAATQRSQDEWDAVLQMLWLSELENHVAERSTRGNRASSIDEIDNVFACWD